MSLSVMAESAATTASTRASQPTIDHAGGQLNTGLLQVRIRQFTQVGVRSLLGELPKPFESFCIKLRRSPTSVRSWSDAACFPQGEASG
jgi:hypothetical protein